MHEGGRNPSKVDESVDFDLIFVPLLLWKSFSHNSFQMEILWKEKSFFFSLLKHKEMKRLRGESQETSDS